MLWHHRTAQRQEAEPYRLPPVLPPADPDDVILVMHKGLGPARIDEMTRAEADRKAGLRKKPKRA